MRIKNITLFSGDNKFTKRLMFLGIQVPSEIIQTSSTSIWDVE